MVSFHSVMHSDVVTIKSHFCGVFGGVCKLSHVWCWGRGSFDVVLN